MKIQIETGPLLPSLCQGALDVVEACHHHWHRKVHGVELTNQALQIFPADVAFYGQDIQEGLLQEGDFARLSVYRKNKDLLDTGPVFLPHQEVLDGHQMLYFFGQGWGDPLKGSNGATKDLDLSFNNAFQHCDGIIHITVYMGEAIQGVCQAYPCLGDFGNSTVPRHWK